MKYLSREEILGASDIEVREIEVPEWGGTVLVRELTTTEVENFSIRTSNPHGELDISKMPGLRAEVVSWALVDEDGKQLMHKKDAEALQKRSHRIIDRLFNAILVMSDLREPDESEGEKKA